MRRRVCPLPARSAMSCGWSTAGPGGALGLPGLGTGDPALPFLLQDIAGRDLRIPAGRVPHPNGVTGIAGVVLSTSDPDGAVAHYRPLFGAGTPRGAGGGTGRRDDFAPGACIGLHPGLGTIETVVLSHPGPPETPVALRKLRLAFEAAEGHWLG